ncbi:MAG: hypothetical protein WCI27_07325 [Candidatus Omnitrophota bacterium]
MKTQCKSCQNWRAEIPVAERAALPEGPSAADVGWCVNFKRIMFNHATCGEWRLKKN